MRNDALRPYFWQPMISYFWRAFLAWIRSEPPKPAIVWTDANGVGWRARPDYMEPWQPDTGQHEVLKRYMRVFLWRLLRGVPGAPAGSTAPVTIDPEAIGLGGMLIEAPRLLPMGQELAAFCRRHGFANAARASMPEAREAELLGAWTCQQAAMNAEVDRMMERAAETARTWNPVHGPLPGEPREALIALLDCGPCEAADRADGRKIAGLAPIVLREGWLREKSELPAGYEGAPR